MTWPLYPSLCMNIKTRQLAALAAFIVATISCQQPPEKGNDIDHFHSMLNNYWKGLMKLQTLDATMFSDSTMNDQFVNNCTQEYRNEQSSFYKSYLDSLSQFDPEKMKEEDALSYQIIKYDASSQLEKAKYDYWKIPFTQMGDATNTISANIVLAMGQLGSGQSAQPFKTVRDYDNWLKRVHGYPIWCDSAIANFRHGLRIMFYQNPW
jgi:uncharacterized protein (DUF885 family)